MGQWYDKLGWNPGLGSRQLRQQHSNPPANTGLLWHELDSKIPTSGWVSPLFFYNPRLGVAYDVTGTGRTVVRAGFGTYRYQVSSNDASGAMGGPLGSFNYGTNGANGNGNGFYGYNIQGGLVCVHPDPGGLAGSCSGPTAKTQQLECSIRASIRTAPTSRPTSKATTRFPMRIPTASA